jgi:anaerobic magnesium-protoporphyrin IX monomethyl ester cyclase
MKQRKVLLIRFPYHGTFLGDASSLPVGLGYVAESLLSSGIDYSVYDMGLAGHDEKGLNLKIDEYRPDLLGITLMTMHYRFHYKLINALKAKCPALPIAVGGPHVSTFRARVLEECKGVDYGVVLEGEESFVELCRGDAPADIKGLIFRDKQGVVYNGDRPFIEDLDKIPFPRYTKFEIDKYLSNTIGIQTTRGCPCACIYCPVHLAIGKRFRARSPESIIAELSYWYKLGKRDFSMLDDNFTLIPERVYKLCDLISENGLKGMSLSIPNGIRGDRAEAAMLKRMREVGFSMISFGVESASNQVLKNLKKGTSIEVIEASIKNACELGYDVCLYFMIGSPGETWQDFEKSVSLVKRYPVMEARFYNIIPFPNTELLGWIKENNYFVRQPDEYLNTADHFVNEPCFATPEFSVSERRKAFRVGWRLTNRLKVRAKARTLKKLGPFRFLAATFLLSMTYRRLFMRSWFREGLVFPLRRIMKGGKAT